MKSRRPGPPAKLTRKTALKKFRTPLIKTRRRVLALFTVGAWGAAQQLSFARQALAQAAPFKVGVKTFKLSNPKPKPGETVSVTMSVAATGRGRKSVPWEILVGNKRIAGGVQRNVLAGRGFSVRARWRATAGLHNFLGKADPRNIFKEKGRDRFDNARGFSVRVAAAAAPGRPTTGRSTTGRSTTTRRPTTRRAPTRRPSTGRAPSARRLPPAEPLTVKVSSFTISPTPPKYDQNANLRFKFKVSGSGQKDVPWVIKRGNQTLASGIQRNAKAGRTYTVNKNWKADFGSQTFGVALDPNNTLGEKSSQRSNNTKSLQVTVPPPDWAAWGTAAFDGAVSAVRVWQTQAYFRNIKVNAVSAIGTPGVLRGPSIKSLIKIKMRTEGCPNAIADKFASAVAKAWKDWQDKVIVPGLPWYPSFAAYPGPQAPPMPNVPTPLVTLPSSKASGLAANSLKSAINAKLGAVKNQPGAQAAINSFATQFSTRFNVWRTGQQVMSVLGKGKVPSFAPPFVPVGPVVNGSARSTPGSALSSKPF
jgi:hypothetical protein